MPSEEEERSSSTNQRCHHKFDDSIPIVRENFLKLIEDGASNGVHNSISDSATCNDIYLEDIEDAKRNDFTIRRFLVANGGKPEAALNSMMEAFKWYKQMAFRDMKDNYFPAEVYQVGAVFEYEPDALGRSTLYVRMKCSPRIPELVDAIKHYVSFLIWKIDQKSREKGWIVITDFDGSSFSRWDLEFARYFVILLKNYFPTGMQLKLCLDIGIIWRGLWFMMKDVLPKRFRDILLFMPRDKLTDYVNIENIPRFLGGSCARPFNGLPVVPPGAPSGMDFAEKVLRLRRSDFNFQPILDKILQDNQKEEESFHDSVSTNE